MEKDKGKKRAAAYAVALAAALFLLLGIGIAYAASLGPTASANCKVLPKLALSTNQSTAAAGRLVSVQISVTGVQPQSCGSQTYGVDFTNGYDGKEFVLAIKGSQDRNLFTLAPGQEKTFDGLIGAPPGTAAKNYTIQVTAYREDDHWAQVSKPLALEVKPEYGSDTSWSTDLTIGWNNIPYALGTGVYGCPGINTAYRYSPYKGDYIVLNRYGALFEPAPFEPNMENEKFGGLFVFSKERCAMESKVPAEAFNSAAVSLRDGQLLSIPSAWHNAAFSKLFAACKSQIHSPSDRLEAKIWDADSQTWKTPAASGLMKNGQAVRLVANYDCTLDLGKPLGQ